MFVNVLKHILTLTWEYWNLSIQNLNFYIDISFNKIIFTEILYIFQVINIHMLIYLYELIFYYLFRIYPSASVAYKKILLMFLTIFVE